MLESISIHAPRTGSDPPFDYNRINAYISIHAPRTGSDVNRFCNRPCINAFQSTLPARGATFQQLMEHNWQIYFNPRSPHGERRGDSMADAGVYIISIHAPRTGSDWVAYNVDNEMPISIHAPRTGSDTTDGDAQAPPRKISIHAPRTGSDMAIVFSVPSHTNFNPRSPHGERRICFSRRFVL